MSRKMSIILGTAVSALVSLSVADNASAGYFDGRYFGYRGDFTVFRAPQSSQNLPGATKRDMRVPPSMGSRGMRGGVGGGGRMNGGMVGGRQARSSIMRLYKPSLARAAVIVPLAAAEARDLPNGDYDRQVRQQRLLGLRAADGPAQYDDSGLVMYGARSPAYGIPQALPGSKMNRGGMGAGAPAMRGTGGMRGRR